MKVTPVINCGDFECARKRFGTAVAIGAETVHIDVSDGIFSPARIGGTPEDLKKLVAEFPGIAAHVHLMVAEPEAVLESWLKAGAKRAIVHVEALKNWPRPQTLAEALPGIINYTSKVELFLGLKKETPIAVLDGFFGEPALKGVHLLAVPIGFSGGIFNTEILEKIKYVKSKAPQVIVNVDGGVGLEVARMVKDAGADEVVSATYIFGSPDPKKAYEELTRI
jgi:ribulose-phosphate 3-epimerase